MHCGLLYFLVNSFESWEGRGNAIASASRLHLKIHLFIYSFYLMFRRGLANQMPSRLYGIMSPGFSVDKDSMSLVAVSFIQGTNDPVLLLFIPDKLLLLLPTNASLPVCQFISPCKKLSKEPFTPWLCYFQQANQYLHPLHHLKIPRGTAESSLGNAPSF